MNILFVGGTGQISLPCVEQAIAAGHKVAVFNRGTSDEALPAGVESIVGDMNDAAAYGALGSRKFDTVCQFMVFRPEQMDRDIAVFSGNTSQYIFISSASVYEKPPRHYIITEKTPAINPYWPYSQAKIVCEEKLKAAANLPWTIVRPSHTVRNGLPTMMNEGDVVAHRMLAGKPVIVCGDGATPWTLTRSADFAKPFVGLFGKDKALKDIFHITAGRGHTWDEIYRGIAAGVGVEAKIVHVPTDVLCRYEPEWEGPLAGDKTWAALFDNSKVKSVAGDFTCVEDLARILAEPVRYFKKRRAASGPQSSKLDPLFDRIAGDMATLGRA